MKEEKSLIEQIKILVENEANKKGKSLNAVSIDLGMNSRYLSNIFNKNKDIKVQILYDISTVLECEVSTLLPPKQS